MKRCSFTLRLLTVLLLWGAFTLMSYSQRVMSFGYDQSGNIVHRQYQSLTNYLSSSSSKYTAKLYSSPTTGYVRIVVEDEHGMVGCPCGVQVYRVGSAYDESVVNQRYDNGEHISFDISNCLDGVYVVKISVDINNPYITNLPPIKIIKLS